jgi:hypothetical protein
LPLAPKALLRIGISRSKVVKPSSEQSPFKSGRFAWRITTTQSGKIEREEKAPAQDAGAFFI